MLLVLGLVACGSEVNPDGGGGSGGDGAGGANPACEGFEDAAPGGPVTVRFVNETPIDIYLAAGCGDLSLTFTPVGGATDVYFGKVTPSGCSQTCEMLQTESQNLCDAAPCQETSIRVPAGGTHEETWDGRGYASREMPGECWFDEVTGQGSCAQIISAPQGDYEVVVSAWDTCSSFEPDGLCMCDADGLCYGGATGTQPAIEPVVFSMPGTNLVEYVFEPCAFGCAEPL
jgi:hypothetical protein